MIPSELLDFHVWSSPKNIPAFSYDFWTSKDYDGYRERGMQVHLDEQIDSNDDMLTAWTHMARASVFIMSQSSFSMVPAYMNVNCVIFPSNIDAPMENWVNGKDESRGSSLSFDIFCWDVCCFSHFMLMPLPLRSHAFVGALWVIPRVASERKPCRFGRDTRIHGYGYGHDWDDSCITWDCSSI